MISFAYSDLTPEKNGKYYWNFSTTTDIWGSYDMTNSGAQSVAVYPTFNVSGNSAPTSFRFLANESDRAYTANVDLSDYRTISIWAKTDGAITSGVIGST